MSDRQLTIECGGRYVVLRFNGAFADERYDAVAASAARMIDDLVRSHYRMCGELRSCECGWRPFYAEVPPGAPQAQG